MAAIAPVADRHRLLHVASAAAHDRDRVAKRERAGGDVRRVLAKAVSGDEGRARCRARQHAARRDAGGQDRRLRVLGQRQLILGPLEAERAQTTQMAARRRVKAASASSNVGAGLREALGERLPHADLLRSLSGKDERDHA